MIEDETWTVKINNIEEASYIVKTTNSELDSSSTVLKKLTEELDSYTFSN